MTLFCVLCEENNLHNGFHGNMDTEKFLLKNYFALNLTKYIKLLLTEPFKKTHKKLITT